MRRTAERLEATDCFVDFYAQNVVQHRAESIIDFSLKSEKRRDSPDFSFCAYLRRQLEKVDIVQNVELRDREIDLKDGGAVDAARFPTLTAHHLAFDADANARHRRKRNFAHRLA